MSTSRLWTEVIFYTLRNMEVYAYRYDENHKEIAKALLLTIPWYAWPKNRQGDMLYQAVNILADGNQGAYTTWQKRWDCPYQLNGESGWYWLIAWAIHEKLEYYLKGL